MPTELHQRARAAVRIVERVTGRRYTIAQFLREAIVAQLAVIARDYNRGREIYPDSEPLEPGRR
ncbi:50S ribosomal protein L7ae [Mycolicibacterium grossiae]|uniref:50S ribosomal protein L7ae n=1 Tax=Mycolicibacterium grossiae TaxID=1552759 RepID=A0A1E8Q821_9MYCO|nr:50S ribosomal protein L7ae [Mycolicibacterium grossiae]